MSKTTLAVASAAVLGASAYLYATPYISINQFREAIESKDLPGIERHVDFPSLRGSLKEQLKVKMAEDINRQSGGDPFVNFGMSALGYAMAEPLINAAVDTYISPAGLKALMAGSQPSTSNSGASSAPESAAVSMDYKTPNLFVVTSKDSRSGQAVKLNFERHGLVQWQLASVSLP
jgi:hypothetical protein